MKPILESFDYHKQQKAETTVEAYLNALLENAPCPQNPAYALYVALVSDLVRGDYQLPILKAQFGFYNHNTPAAFREHVGSAPQVFKTYHRMELAKRLLQETECTVSDIPLSLLGYNAVNAFCMNFKKHV